MQTIVSDVSKTPKLLTGEEETVYGDSGYTGATMRQTRRQKFN